MVDSKNNRILFWLLAVLVLGIGLSLCSCQLVHSYFPDARSEESSGGPDSQESGALSYDEAVKAGYDGSMADWFQEVYRKSGSGSGSGEISSLYFREDGHLMVVFPDGSVWDAGIPSQIDGEGYSQKDETVAATVNVKVRSTPDTETEENYVGVLYAGTLAQRVGENRVSGWSKVLYNGETRFIKSSALEVVPGFSPGDVPLVSLADDYVMLVDRTQTFCFDEFILGRTPEMTVVFTYSGHGKCEYTDSSYSFSEREAGKYILTLEIKKYYNQKLYTIYRKSIGITVMESADTASKTGLIIGDSRIAEGTIAKELGKQVRLLGTLGTENGYHEGRGAWSTANYLKSSSAFHTENPFYNPDRVFSYEGGKHHFDFSYYLETQNYAVPDFVILCLGANDLFSAQAAANLEAMAESIRAVSDKTGVFIMTEYLTSTGPYAYNLSSFDAASHRDLQARFNLLLMERFSGREAEGIYLVPNYLLIDNLLDRLYQKKDGLLTVYDYAHLGVNGYRKEAELLFAYLCYAKV